MWNLLFENNRDLSREKIEELAGQLQLNMKKFRAALEDATIADKISNQSTEANRLGARGTPSFFVNGRFISGAQPLENFKVVIDKELKRADKLLASGVSREQLYGKLVADGKTGM
jgi:protein-disulfide isomerase